MQKPLHQHKYKTQIRRALTLVSFFHFCGVNNGLSFVSLTSGNLETIELTPALVRQAARMINPIFWNRRIKKRIFGNLLSKSQEIIQSSSRKAARNLCQDPILLRVWLTESLKPSISWGTASWWMPIKEGKNALVAPLKDGNIFTVKGAVRVDLSGAEDFQGNRSPWRSVASGDRREVWFKTDYDDFWNTVRSLTPLQGRPAIHKDDSGGFVAEPPSGNFRSNFAKERFRWRSFFLTAARVGESDGPQELINERHTKSRCS